MIEWLSQHLSPAEVGAVIFGLAYVVLAARQNIWCWPAGLVGVALSIIVYVEARLYADVGLQVVYIGLSVYGWWYWLQGGRGGPQVAVTRLAPRTGGVLATAAMAATFFLGWALSYTDADVPFWDSGTTVFSLVAQWLSARKVLESWLLWMVVDVVFVGVYVYKSLWLFAGLYALFCLLAGFGWVEWRRASETRRDG